MAKDNLFLGMARGKVGDVVFYRSNGTQLSRVRNRNPKNPKSDAQLVQRAIAATISQAYKAGKVIFDHSFEGREVPSGCQRRFLSVNMKQLRAAVLQDLATPAASTSTRVVSPSATYPVPWCYRISEGSLFQTLFTFSVDTSGSTPQGPVANLAAASSASETLAEYASRLGLEEGEIFTVCGIGFNGSALETDLISPECAFGFVRLIVKDVSSSTTLVSAATYGDLFEIDSSGSTFPDAQALTQGLNIDQVVSSISANLGALGVIRSNENSGLRSTSDMVTIYDIDDSAVDAYGVAPVNLLSAWSDASGGVDSSLILEGGGF